MKTITETLKEMEQTGEIKKAGKRIKVNEVLELIHKNEDNPFMLILDAFNAGYHRGVIAERNRQRKASGV